MVARGEIWLVALDPTIGRELKKTRPAVVVSPDELNQAVGTVIVAPMTTGARGAPFRVPLLFEGTKGLILAEQVRAVDALRLVKRIGRVPSKTMAQTLRVLRETFAD